MVLPLLSAHGAIYTDAEIQAAAVWQAPLPPKPGRARELLVALSMMAALRSASSRGLQLSRVVARSHPRVPHWYLGILGTSPDHQGRGVGSSVLAPILERCDADGVPAYLESSKRRNIPFYERHGFSVTGELIVEGGPTLWPMLRAPRRPASRIS
jgi:GNAT superfamily N-acetyltransferase